MTIVTVVALAQFANLDSATIAKGYAYSVAQAVRTTQAYATQVRSDNVNDIDFALAYGIQFSRGSGEMQIFAYRGTSTVPQLDADAGVIEYRYLPNGYTISSLCVKVSGEADERCATTDGQKMSVSFRRPDIASLPYAEWYTISANIERTRIAVRGPGTLITHWIEVGKTGSITVTTDAP